MQKLTAMELGALLMVAGGNCHDKNDDYEPSDLAALEKLDYITPYSEFRARSLTKHGEEVMKEVLRATQGLRILNEDEPSEHVRQMMEGAIGIVEANSFEKMCLWQRYHQELRKTWEQGKGGFIVTIGWVGFSPVCVSINCETIDGKKILFIDPTSIMVDHELIERWLKKFAPKTAFKSDGKYLNMNDAMNFNNCLR